jgi:hypothetical protein
LVKILGDKDISIDKETLCSLEIKNDYEQSICILRITGRKPCG